MGSKSAIGIGNGICFKQVRDKGGGSYIDPLVRDSIVGLWKFDQNTNESPTRNIIKNTIKDKGGDLELLNFGYKLNSGFGKYEEDFTSWKVASNETVEAIVDAHSCKVLFNDNRTYLAPVIVLNANNTFADTPSFNVDVSFTDNVTLQYFYMRNGIRDVIDLKPGVNTVPLSENSTIAEGTSYNIGFVFYKTSSDYASITITQIPSFQGALVTDGKDDMIVSQKTVQEMLGGSNVCTVVSMIHQINLSASINTSINNIRSESVDHVCARHLNTAYGKTGIFGYSKQLNTTSNPTLINNILGDKKDYIAEGNTVIDTTDKYFVQGYKYNASLHELSEVAVYWTFISNKVLTTDEINQIIAYFKLDKYVTPQVIYDVKRQGLTNDTPNEDWYLKDFSGNGHDMQLYNYAKSKDSGIGKYAEDFTNTDWIAYPNVVVSKDKITVNSLYDEAWFIYKSKNNRIPPMKIKIVGIPANAVFMYRYCKNSSDTDATYIKINEEGIYDLPESVNGNTFTVGFMVQRDFDWTHIEITQIPDYEGALVSDGKDDYGKAEGLPIFKDYTVAADYARLAKNISSIGDSPILSKSMAAGNGAFIMNNIDNSGITACYSFGTDNSITLEDIQRKIYYQSKYSNQGKGINAGSIEDGTSMWLNTIRDNDTRFIESTFYSMLLFPYSLSEFLLERQLKKYKLGTLYPGMIEWRPKVNINVPVVTPPTFSMNNGSDIITNGQYIPEGTEITIRIFTTTDSSVGGLNEATAKINGVDIELSPSGNKTYYGGKFIASSKQKIDITIDEYIRYEDIVQPYPAIINLKQDGKTITWGDKLKVGSEVTFVNHTNLLPDLYTVSGGVQYNGTSISWNTSIRVEKSMVFVNPHSYKKANEPNCILSPQTLRIPNASYKILGYIPDLTGKGNHGKINNSAYAEMSGANGYSEDFTSWLHQTEGTLTDSKFKATGIASTRWVLYKSAGYNFPTNTYIVTGIPNNVTLTYNDGTNIVIIENRVPFTISAYSASSATGFVLSKGVGLDLTGLIIEQIGKYEGSFCLDGIEDFLTIPTLSHGAKQILIKVNWQTDNTLAYDQRVISGYPYYFAIYTSNEGSIIAYNPRNTNGKTYIDGVLNSAIFASQLKGITHNITITNNDATENRTTSPVIGSGVSHNGFFTKMALFTFMPFDEISSEDEIKELNDIVGIEGGYVESPDYYWDAYGKNNLATLDIDYQDLLQSGNANKMLIDKSKAGLAALDLYHNSGNNSELINRRLTANNFAYNEESGYVDNGLVSDGVDDNLKNTNMPVLTDYTWIMKRKRLNDKSSTTLCHKGNGSNSNAFLFEFIENTTNVRSFGADSTVVFPDLISWQTKNSYNGQTIASGTSIDGNALHIFMGSNVYPYYTKAVFYKSMLYSKTIDQLSVNMLKNLFERDELIDVNNPIFKKKEL